MTKNNPTGSPDTRQIKTQWPEVRVIGLSVIGLSMMEDDHLIQSHAQSPGRKLFDQTLVHGQTPDGHLRG